MVKQELTTSARPERVWLLEVATRDRRGLQALPGGGRLQVAHGIEPVPAGADQGRRFPALGNGLGGIEPMLQGVPVARWAANPVSAAVHPAPLPPRHRRLTAWCSVSRPGMASRTLVHGQG